MMLKLSLALAAALPALIAGCAQMQIPYSVSSDPLDAIDGAVASGDANQNGIFKAFHKVLQGNASGYTNITGGGRHYAREVCLVGKSAAAGLDESIRSVCAKEGGVVLDASEGSYRWCDKGGTPLFGWNIPEGGFKSAECEGTVSMVHVLAPKKEGYDASEWFTLARNYGYGSAPVISPYAQSKTRTGFEGLMPEDMDQINADQDAYLKRNGWIEIASDEPNKKYFLKKSPEPGVALMLTSYNHQKRSWGKELRRYEGSWESIGMRIRYSCQAQTVQPIESIGCKGAYLTGECAKREFDSSAPIEPILPEIKENLCGGGFI